MQLRKISEDMKISEDNLKKKAGKCLAVTQTWNLFIVVLCHLIHVVDDIQYRDVKFVFFHIWTLFVKFEFYSNFVYVCGRVSLFWLWLYTYSILYNMAFMWSCSVLGPGRILVLLIACFITFYVCRALQQKRQCIIYVVHCIYLLSENSSQISIRDSNTECIQFKF